MNNETIINVLKQEIRDRYGREVEPRETDTLVDLGFDSLDTIELWLTLEEVYCITIPEEEAKNLNTVADVVRLVNNYVDRKQK